MTTATDAAPGGALAAASGQAADLWEQVPGRVADYLRALGITDPLHLERLGERICGHVAERAAKAKLENPLEAAIEETYDQLEGWLSTELALVGDCEALFTARAAVLSGAVPGWAARFAGVVGAESCAAAIRAAGVQALPEYAPLIMVPNTIELFWHRVGNRIKDVWHRVGRLIAAGLRRLIGWLPGDAAATDGHRESPR